MSPATYERNDPVMVGQLLQGVEQAREGFAICDSRGCYTYMNAEHLRMFGFDSLDEVIGRSWTMLYNESEIEVIKTKVFPEIARSGTWNGHLMARRRNGSLFHEELTLSMLPDGGITCNCRDRTAVIELTQRLAEGERVFREFSENLPQCVVIRDAAGVCSHINRMAAQFERGMLRDAVGRRLEQVLPEDLRRAFLDREEEALRTRRAVIYEVDCTLSTGPASLAFTVLPVIDEGGKMINLSILWSDVTLRRRHELEIAATVERQRELLRLRGEFISLVSHEFRTPLSAIQSSHFLIKKVLGDDAPPKIARYLALQEQSIGNLTDLVNQVLQLNRAESDRAGSGLKPERPSPLLADIIDHFNDAAENPRVQRHLDLPEDLEVMLDERLFRAAVENLISNALKYSPLGSVVTVEAGSESGQLHVSVQDHGRGIPQAEQSRLFEAFFRGSNVRSVPGTGLGLAIVQRAVEFHGGRVTFESTENVGSTFRLSIPLQRPAPPVVPANETAAL